MTRVTTLLLLAALLQAQANPLFHVAPKGNDAHDGSADRPFATLDRARKAVRDHLTRHPSIEGDVVVELSGGTYELAAPVRFEPADSGRRDAEVVYRAAPGAKVVLSAGRIIGGWSSETKGQYRTEVGRNVDFRQLWVNGLRTVRARRPNPGQMFEFASERQADGFELPRSELADVMFRSDEIEVSVLIAWMHKRLRISRTEEHGDKVRAVINSLEWEGVTRQPQGDRVYLKRRYWLENAQEFLDAQGEFHLDRVAGILRYRPRPGEEMARATVIRPELENVIVLAGTLAAPVQHLRFEGLIFAHTGWTRPDRAGFVDVQANSLVPADLAGAADPQYRHQQRKDRVPAAIQATFADHITVRACRFSHLGGTGVQFVTGDDNRIEGNAFADLAGGGIELGNDAARPASARMIPRRNIIANNFMTRIGEDYFGSVAILAYYTSETIIAHNEISDIPYTGISVGWGWGNPPAPEGTGHNRILHNRISRFMLRLDDGGGIYTTDRQPGSEIAFNFVEYMLPPDANTKAGGAIYPDQFTEGLLIHDNVVSHALRWLFIWNPNIRGNTIVQNHTDTAALRNDGTDNRIEPAHVRPGQRWPESARTIIENAGLEPPFALLRPLVPPP
ncbi:MAG: right-handed parallel beta-helix repeat-containing protein [Opitutaceae bacterium]|nr:right-handed parallel beta-helix repeat-containing protein [Opitutaceae bacterium]